MNRAILRTVQRPGEKGNFYELSVIDARLKELRAEQVRETEDNKKR